MNTNFIGEAKPLEDLDISRIGSRIGVGEDEIHAFMEVEAASSGFDAKRRPKILFEPHIFYRELSGKARQRAVEAGLAYSSWGEQPYPKDSYPRLLRAMEINEVAALRSCSWGLGQILGLNHRAAGYATVRGMIESFMADEENHLQAMINFLIHEGIDDDLRAHRWEVVARVYNGPAYAKHGYHTRLEAAYRKWKRIPDTPLDGTPVAASAYPTIKIGERSFLATQVQTKLKDAGYALGAVDGHFGAATRVAVLAFQADHGLTTDGVIGPKTWDVLLHSAVAERISPERANATMADLREKDSGTVKKGDRGQTILGMILATGGLGGIAENLGDLSDLAGVSDRAFEVVAALQEVSGTLSEIATTAKDNWWLILIAGAAYGVYTIHQLKKTRLEDHQTGKHMGR